MIIVKFGSYRKVVDIFKYTNSLLGKSVLVCTVISFNLNSLSIYVFESLTLTLLIFLTGNLLL